MAALGPVGKHRRCSGRFDEDRGWRTTKLRGSALGSLPVTVLMVACAAPPPPAPPPPAPQTFTPGLYAVFPAPARHRDAGSEHHWELCHEGGYFHLMCSSAWSGGVGEETLDVKFRKYGEAVSVLIDRIVDFDGYSGRRVRYAVGDRVYDWLLVPTEESTFVMTYEGPNTERSRSFGEFFMQTFSLEPGAECPSVVHARYDETQPAESPASCTGAP